MADQLTWACCTSSIGPACQHRRNPDGTVQPMPAPAYPPNN